MEFLLKLLGHSHFFCTETVVSEKHSDFYSNLDQVLDDFLSLCFISGVLFGDTVQFIQNLAAGVVNEHLHRAFGGHRAEDLLLRLHGHVLGAEGIHDCLNWQEKDQLLTVWWFREMLKVVVSSFNNFNTTIRILHLFQRTSKWWFSFLKDVWGFELMTHHSFLWLLSFILMLVKQHWSLLQCFHYQKE